MTPPRPGEKTLSITQAELDRTDLVVLADAAGKVRWSSKRSREQTVAMLRHIADGIEDGSL
jgi:hypothetical protein